jgi:hypothetical protein
VKEAIFFIAFFLTITLKYKDGKNPVVTEVNPDGERLAVQIVVLRTSRNLR